MSGAVCAAMVILTTGPVQASARPPAGEDVHRGTRATVPVRHDIATVLIMQRLVLDATECYVFSCPVKMQLFLLPSPLQLCRVCKSHDVWVSILTLNN